MMKGKFTLRDMYKQLEALNKMGPLKQIMSMLPMGNMEFPEGVYDVTSTKMMRYRIIMDSMTPKELDDPALINSSRMQRIAHGAGATPDEVRELLKYLQDDAAHPERPPRWRREIQYAAPDETLLRNAVDDGLCHHRAPCPDRRGFFP